MPEQTSTERVDVVVVGSGFGGSVTAYRMASGGRSVVVLERGRAYPPGSFPRTPSGISHNFWEPSAGRHGLFQMWSFAGLDGIASAGLGGGSLIYANVLLRKDEKWFVHEHALPNGGYEHWPISRADLDPHYDVVEQMIGVSAYPYTDTPKTNAMRQAADGAGLSVSLPPLAISFSRRPGEEPVRMGEIPAPDYGNIHGLPRATCVGCGECDLGCNFGSKNTLDHTYLSAAQHAGADVRVRHEVKGFRPLGSDEGGGYEVTYVVHTGQDGEPAVGLTVHTIRCERLVLSAGTFGSSYLLLRNRAALPGLSDALGTRFSGNGDLLGFVMQAMEGEAGRQLAANTGPVITSAIRVADEADAEGSTGRGHYIQDAGYPAFGAWLAETTGALGTVGRAAKFATDRLIGQLTDSDATSVGADLALMLGDARLTSTSLPLLGMGRDIPDGVLRLSEGRLEVDWTTETSLEYFNGVRGTMRTIAEQLGGSYMDNPLWWIKRVITVHPLGGAPMGRHDREGVCDSYGEVYGHPGLYVLDGALLPGPVGANPSLTIAAVADRAATHLLETTVASSRTSPAPAEDLPEASSAPQPEDVAPPVEEGRSPVTRPSEETADLSPGLVTGAGAPSSTNGPATADLSPGLVTGAGAPSSTNGPATADLSPGLVTGAGAPSSTNGPATAPSSTNGPATAPSSTNVGVSGIRFTEQMKGFAALGVDDPQTGHDEGKRARERMMFELTIAVDDVDRFVSEPGHLGTAEGYVDCDLLGGRLEVERGWFNLFVEADDPDQRRMLYRLWLTGPGGNPMTFTGFKEVRDEPGLDVWRDTSTLYVKVLDGHVDPDGGDDGVPVLGAGVITIHIPDFMKQLTTFRTWGDHRVGAMEGFGRLFLGQLWEVYGRFARDTEGDRDEHEETQ